MRDESSWKLWPLQLQFPVLVDSALLFLETWFSLRFLFLSLFSPSHIFMRRAKSMIDHFGTDTRTRHLVYLLFIFFLDEKKWNSQNNRPGTASWPTHVVPNLLFRRFFFFSFRWWKFTTILSNEGRTILHHTNSMAGFLQNSADKNHHFKPIFQHILGAFLKTRCSELLSQITRQF